MSAKEFPFICECGYNTMDAKSASEHIATCPRLDDDPDQETPKPSHTATLDCPRIIEDNRARIIIFFGQDIADYIFKCVNSHDSDQVKIDALVGALKAVYADIELQNVQGGSDELNQIVQSALKQAREAV